MQEGHQKTAGKKRLKRNLGLVLLTLYGVGIVVGARIIVTNLALMRLHQTEPRLDISRRAPRWIPPFGALGAAGLLAAQLI
ncbi:MAG: hypothetical protein EXR08_11805 [Alphaproteobacteria bacterium]|nr:hypothetical protein [Alphaproteobacteria bacterium]